MNTSYSLTLLLITLAGVCALLVAQRSEGSRPAFDHFRVFALVMLCWLTARAALSSAVDLLVPANLLRLARIETALELFATLATYELMLLLMQRAAPRRRVLTPLRLAVCGVALCTVFTPWTIDHIDPSALLGVVPAYGPLGLVHMAVACGLMIDLAWRYRMSVGPWRVLVGQPLRRDHLVGVAMLCAFLVQTEIFVPLRWPVAGVQLVALAGFIVSMLVLLFRWDLVSARVQLAASDVVRHMPEGTLITDIAGIVLSANQRAASLLGYPAAELIGKDLHALLGLDAPLATLASAPEQLKLSVDAATLVTLPNAQASEADALLWVDQTRDVDTERSAHAMICILCPLRSAVRTAEAGTGRIESLGVGLAGALSGLTDSLTGLPSRAMYLSHLYQLLDHGRSKTGAEQLRVVCVIAVKRMRIINQDLGFGTGDKLLREIANRLGRLAGPETIVSRIGGDEFSIARRCSTQAERERWLDSITHELAIPFSIGDYPLHLSAVMAVATSDDLRAAELFKAACDELGKWRGEAVSGIKRVMSGCQAVSRNRTRDEAALRRGLEAGELQPWYQPVVCLNTKRIVGFEALVRWVSDVDGPPVLPGVFVPLAEETGLMAKIDRLVVEQVTSDLAQMIETFGKPLSISANLCAAELFKPGVEHWIGGLVRQKGLPAGALRIEVLERDTLDPSALGVLERLQAAGVALSIDDFGTGYSSLSRLHELSVSVLKVDRAFVLAMRSENGMRLIDGIISLASGLSLNTVAEGVERIEELEALEAMGCDHVQGFMFSKAVPFDQAMELLACNQHWVDAQIDRARQKAAA